MYCATWNELYEEYEKATLKRVAQRKNRFLITDPCRLEQLNFEVAETLRQLHKHEQIHRCHG